MHCTLVMSAPYTLHSLYLARARGGVGNELFGSVLLLLAVVRDQRVAFVSTVNCTAWHI